MVAARECRFGTALFLQPGQRKFDVLAGAQFVARVIRTGTEIVAWPQAPNGHTIVAFRLRIADAKIREEGLCSHIFQVEQLFAPELPPQRALPVHRSKIGRGVGAGKLGFLVGFGGRVDLVAFDFYEDIFLNSQ